MAYPAVPDRRIPYDNDGTVVGAYNIGGAPGFSVGINTWLTGGQKIDLNDVDVDDVVVSADPTTYWWFFFPEQREITAYVSAMTYNGQPQVAVLQGSNDTTNGVDGSWETASLPSGSANVDTRTPYDWRALIKPVSFTGGKRTLRMSLNRSFGSNVSMIHLYGEKVAGQTPDDLVFIDHDTTPGVEYASVEDFGDRPLATSVVRQFRVKNVSTTKTANAINLQCNDTDFAISTDGVTWVVTINIASLAPGAESSTMYVRNTTPAIGGFLGPRFARIVAIVGSWT